MNNIIVRELTLQDADAFILSMKQSETFHHPWITAPITHEEFQRYLQKSDQKSFVVCDTQGKIAGVFNISGIVYGLFQSAYLGYYATVDYAEKGYMSAGLKQVLSRIFNDLKLHRIEANIQPENVASIQLVKNNGFRYEGFAPHYLKVGDEWKGHEHWAMTYEDYIKIIE